jgi:hypothetical protein
MESTLAVLTTRKPGREPHRHWPELGDHRLAHRDCKLNAVDPFAYLSATLTAIVNGHRQSKIDVLMPWNYPGRTNG